MGQSKMRRIAGCVSLALVVVLGVGCARARVKNIQEATSAPLPRPARVVVFDFSTGGADVSVGTSPRRSARNAVGLSVPEPDLIAESVADALASRLVTDIGAGGLQVVRAAGAPAPALNDIVVQGQFVTIDQGSATQRFVIGFGLGATEVRTQVEIFQVTAEGWRPIKQFDTVATGARFPGAGFFVAGGAAAGGAVATSAIVSSGVGTLREFRASVEADAGRTSEQIATKFSELSTAQKW